MQGPNVVYLAEFHAHHLIIYSFRLQKLLVRPAHEHYQ